QAQGAVPLALISPSLANPNARSDAAAELNVDVNGIQVKNIAKSADASGAISLHMEARAPRFEADAITGNLLFNELNVKVGDINIDQQGKSSLSVANGIARVDHFELAGPDTMISSEGTVTLTGDKPLSVRLNVSTNAGLVS